MSDMELFQENTLDDIRNNSAYPIPYDDSDTCIQYSKKQQPKLANNIQDYCYTAVNLKW